MKTARLDQYKAPVFAAEIVKGDALDKCEAVKLRLSIEGYHSVILHDMKHNAMQVAVTWDDWPKAQKFVDEMKVHNEPQ